MVTERVACTVQIDADLHRCIVADKARTGRSVKWIVNDALRAELERRGMLETKSNG